MTLASGLTELERYTDLRQTLGRCVRIWEPSLSIYLVLTDQTGKRISLPRN